LCHSEWVSHAEIPASAKASVSVKSDKSVQKV
jgi:hypothetical protein